MSLGACKATLKEIDHAPSKRPTGNRTAANAHRGGCIFIGAPSHQFCGVCVEIVAAEIAKMQRG
jgi:hypothetical protein